MRDGGALASFANATVLVLGDVILDRFVTGTASRLCREQPVPVVRRERDRDVLGGAGNVVANLRALGAAVRFVSLAGDDATGARVRELLAACGADDAWVAPVPGARTAAKTRIVAGDHYIVRVDDDACGLDAAANDKPLVDRLEAAYAGCDAVVVADYEGGVVRPAVVRALARAHAARPVPLVVDARDPLRFPRLAADVLTPNFEDAAHAAGLRVDEPTPANLAALATALFAKTRADGVAITLGGAGVYVARRRARRGETIAARKVRAVNSVGAGDSFAAALTLALASGATPAGAARIGLEAAAVAVAKPFTATVSLEELRQRLDLLRSGDQAPPRAATARLAATLRRRRERGERIVFTNGVFDMLHDGHVALLQRARRMGDVLVVALNDDASARAVKGDGRPINDCRHRRAVLEALECVDYVVPFRETDATRLVAAFAPDVYVRGDDRDLAELPEAAVAREAGARIVLLPRTTATTTRGIVARVRARSPFWSPAEDVAR